MIPDLKPGLRLVCIKPTDPWLVGGQVYTVTEVMSGGRRHGDLMIGVDQTPKGLLFWPGRFEVAKDQL